MTGEARVSTETAVIAEDEFIDRARDIIRGHSGIDVPRSSLGRVYDTLIYPPAIEGGQSDA